MQYFKIDDNKFIQYDEATNQVKIINKIEIESKIKVLQTKINSIPNKPTDKELLEWAKKNYPQKISDSVIPLTKTFEQNQNLLKELESVK